MRRTGTRTRWSRSAVAVGLGAVALIGAGIAAAPVGAAARAPGTGTPPKGSGINTAAAIEDAKCNPDAGPYGRWNGTAVGNGPVCVAPFAEGDDNGGATARGVTADAIVVVAVTPNDEQTAIQVEQGGTPPRHQVTGQVGTMEDALTDLLAAYSEIYETWGRDVELKFVQSTGDDEAAQRADVVTVKQLDPFAVIDATPTGLGVLETTLAADKYLVFGYATTTDDAIAQAPYRWGQADQTASLINTAEFAGKQLVGKKAVYAGDDDMHGETRVFGIVYPEGVVNLDFFSEEFEQYGGKIPPGAVFTYTSNGSTVGDPVTAQQQAPTIITKLKSLGVNNVIMFTDASMTGALTEQATQQEYMPEWTIAAYQYQDLALLARGYDQDQWAHAFGISNLFPCTEDNGSSCSTSVSALTWYWGENTATSSTPGGAYMGWLMNGIHLAGPDLTVKNFKKGYFAAPASGGAATGSPASFQTGYGRTVGLPYDEYLSLNTDFAPVWWDSESTGLSQIFPTTAQGVEWYLDGAKRYRAGQWPTKSMKFFSESDAISSVATSPVPAPVPVPCVGCPSEGGPGTPAAAASGAA
jgi:hypothetical protein